MSESMGLASDFHMGSMSARLPSDWTSRVYSGSPAVRTGPMSLKLFIYHDLTGCPLPPGCGAWFYQIQAQVKMLADAVLAFHTDDVNAIPCEYYAVQPGWSVSSPNAPSPVDWEAMMSHGVFRVSAGWENMAHVKCLQRLMLARAEDGFVHGMHGATQRRVHVLIADPSVYTDGLNRLHALGSEVMLIMPTRISIPWPPKQLQLPCWLQIVNDMVPAHMLRGNVHWQEYLSVVEQVSPVRQMHPEPPAVPQYPSGHQTTILPPLGGSMDMMAGQLPPLSEPTEAVQAGMPAAVPVPIEQMPTSQLGSLSALDESGAASVSVEDQYASSEVPASAPADLDVPAGLDALPEAAAPTEAEAPAEVPEEQPVEEDEDATGAALAADGAAGPEEAAVDDTEPGSQADAAGAAGAAGAWNAEPPQIAGAAQVAPPASASASSTAAPGDEFGESRFEHYSPDVPKPACVTSVVLERAKFPPGVSSKCVAVVYAPYACLWYLIEGVKQGLPAAQELKAALPKHLDLVVVKQHQRLELSCPSGRLTHAEKQAVKDVFSKLRYLTVYVPATWDQVANAKEIVEQSKPGAVMSTWLLPDIPNNAHYVLRGSMLGSHERAVQVARELSKRSLKSMIPGNLGMPIYLATFATHKNAREFRQAVQHHKKGLVCNDRLSLVLGLVPKFYGDAAWVPVCFTGVSDDDFTYSVKELCRAVGMTSSMVDVGPYPKFEGPSLLK